MTLSHLLAPLGLTPSADPEVTALTCDSRRVTPGTLFAALEGARTDGSRFVPQALDRGACAILAARPLEAPVPVILHPDPRAALALLAARFYGDPARELTLIAVTGTKGKTTTAHMLREILAAAGHTVGMIGTLGAFLGEQPIAPAFNTTPEPVQLHSLLRRLADGGCTHVVMEVSSQALKHRRTAGLTFAAALFLNLTPDHIGPGEHDSFEEYRACKAALFSQCALAVGDAADPAWPFMAARVPPGVSVLTLPDARLEHDTPLTARMVLPEGDFPVPLPGDYNARNALAAITLARALGVADHSIRAGLARVRVPGRSQTVPNRCGIGVVVDYAHNAASFHATLSALSALPHRRLIAVFGAGGDRPPMRRADLGRAAARWADFAVLTADNPRSELVETICAHISAAMPALPHVIIPDRAAAIRFALDLARPGDLVALLGKGHEDYIEVRGTRHPHSDFAVAQAWFAAQPPRSAPLEDPPKTP